MNVKPKVKAATEAGAAATLIVFALQRFVGVEVPPDVALAVGTVLVFVAGYVKRDDRPE